MSYFFSRGKYYLDCGSKIINSAISNTTIDMSGGVITNAGTPINPTDLVTKDYVDGFSVPSTIVTLTGTAYTQILPYLKGVLDIYVKNIVTDGPCAKFTVTKSEANREMSYFRSVISPGYSTEEKLELKWDVNSNIFLRKTGNNYNGQYTIKYISNV
jgi:hypothetical protein